MKCLKCSKVITDEPVYGLHVECFQTWFKLPVVDQFTDIERKSAASKDPDKDTEPSKHELNSLNSSFFHGKFKKYSALLNGESYILKVKDDDYPELPDVEYVCNQLAEALDIPVAQFYLIEFHELRTFVTKNFVRSTSALSNLNHLYHYLEPGEEFSCETLLRTIERQTGRYTDVDIFVRVCLFDALIGNHDRHGRNLGFLETSKTLHLSPIYDNPSALGIESGEFLRAQFSPKGKIFTKESKEPSMRDYIVEFNRLGHNESVSEFCQRLDIDHLHSIVDASTCSPLMREALKRLIEKRAEEVTIV